MNKIYRIIGKRGRTTVPYELRTQMNIHPNDLVSFRCENDEIIIKQERICDDCCATYSSEALTATDELRGFLDSLPVSIKKEALVYLSLGIAQNA